jgi:hypothetical protein
VRFILILSTVVALGACANSPVTTTTSGKPVVSAAMVGSDALILAGVVNLAAAVYATTPNPDAKAARDLQAAFTALTVAGDDLKSSGATSGDVQANINLAYAALQAAEGAATAAASSDAPAVAKLQGYVEVFLASARLYNTDAATLGLPTIALPTA